MISIINNIIHQKAIVWFVWITLFLSLIFELFVGRFGSAFVIALALAMTFMPILLKRWYNIQLPRSLSLFTVFFAYASLFLGEIHDFYEYFWWWDVLLHGCSAMILGIIGLMLTRMMISSEVVRATHFMRSFFAFMFSVALGAIWEVFEFLMDVLFATNMQKSGLVDTMVDLIVDMTGAFIVATLAYLHWKYGRHNFVGHAIERFVSRYNG